MASRLSVLLFGGFRAQADRGDPVVVSGSKAQALLAYLAARPGRRHPRDKLATLLWPVATDESARQSLRQTLLRLRRALAGHGSIVADRDEVWLEGSGVDVDVARFEALVRDGSSAALAEAADIYQGDLLEGLRVKEPPFDEWLLVERERLREQAVGALASLLAHQRGTGPAAPAIRTAMRILALDPAREAAHRELMRLFEGQGRRGDALRQYRLCADALQRELGVEPDAETRRLYREIIRARPASTSQPAAPGPAEPPPSGSGGRRPRDPAPLVGRDAELGRLGAALDAARQGSGGLVVVLGEAGIGKSALLEAIDGEARRRGISCLVGRAYASEQVLAFAPWIDALRGGDVAGPPRALTPSVLSRMGPAWTEQLARLIPEILTGQDSRRAAGEGSEQRLFEAVAHLVASLAADQPRLIALEDVHWADETSLRLLAFVARRIHAVRALVVATAREEEVGGTPLLSRVLEELGADARADRMTLGPLSRDDTVHLVRSLAPARADALAVGRLAEQVFAASNGNPFMIVETVRAVAEGAGRGGRVAGWTPPARLVLPARVQEVIGGRLARLGERSRTLLAAAAVIGREFEFALAQRAAGLDEAAAAEEIETLVRRRLLRVVGERFDFAHDQVRDAVYGELLLPRRTVLHAAVARAIEELSGARPDEHVERLAYHAFRGQLWDRAVQYGQRAGEIAAERSASAQALAHFDQGMQALAHLPESRETLKSGIDLLRLRSSHQFALGDRAAVLHDAEEAMRLAERLADGPTLARTASLRANALWFAGDNRRALEAGRHAVALADASGDLVARIVATLNLGMSSNTSGDHRAAVALLTTAADLLGGVREADRLGRTLYPAVTIRGELARAHAELGEFAAAEARAAEALGIAEALQHVASSLVARLDVVHVQICRGQFHEARGALEPCLHLFRESGLTAWSVSAVGMLGYAQAMTGRLAEGIAGLADAVEQAGQGRRTREGVFTTYLGEAQLRAGRARDAMELGTRALALARERGERGTEAVALRLLGEAAALGPARALEEAARHCKDALAIAEELGLRPLVARCHLSLGAIAGRASGARQHLETAKAMFGGLAMSFWCAEVEARIGAVS